MPPYFGYAMILMMYVLVATVVWVAAAILAVPKSTRKLAKQAALSPGH